ncbi:MULTISPECIES: hypothetical protein [Bacillaceae]|uniref:Uncharacterized protein n=1 Tax=Metabacillus endolithicus TaxID=1535204 RepID=A0ABW5C2G0_9BACI|nr:MULTISPECIES: hypothetical protein [Bacillaceae]MCM3164721.1 hypothetical protein [Metabacillus litoralis]PGT81497.1 hypothetical protein COD11_17350 [Bacillus sp. AFS040349]UGB33598.1 hypothetical protein LPC09_27070 [Metabacillus sp. B2-18]UPG66202.1 hypothetical protein MVE64_26195 [Metabacillus endolithicus]
MFENQLSLFGENVKFINKEEDKSNEKQQAKKEDKKSNKKEVVSSASDKKESKKSVAAKTQKVFENIKEDWTIHYYSNTFQVTEFVNDIPESGISTEQLREEMAKEFFEMSRDRTFWDIDKENKRLFPRITGGAKG